MDLLSYPLISNLLIVHFSLAKVDLSSGFFYLTYKPNCSPFFISSVADISAFNGSLLLLLSLLFNIPVIAAIPANAGILAVFVTLLLLAKLLLLLLLFLLHVFLHACIQFSFKTLLLFLTFPRISD